MDDSLMPLNIQKATRVLTNSIIVDRIGWFLPASDLAPLRRTCALWNLSFLPHLRTKHSPIYLDYWGYAESHGRTHGRSIIDFIELLESNPGTVAVLPFNKYCVGWCYSREFLPFLTLCGPCFTSLTVEKLGHERLETTTIPEIILDQAPNLTELELMFHGDPDDGSDHDEWYEENGFRPTNLVSRAGEPKEIPKFKRFTLHYTGERLRVYSDAVVSIAQAAPNLEWLGLPGPKWCDTGSYDYTDAILKTFSKIRDTNVSLKNLRRLEIDLVKPDALEALADLGRRDENPLRLKSFSVTVTGDGCTNEVQRDADAEGVAQMLSTFLATQSQCLEELTLYASHEPKYSWLDPEQLALIILPRMKALKVLSITHKLEKNSSMLIRCEMRYPDGIDFASTVPGLKKFLLGPGVEIDG